MTPSRQSSPRPRLFAIAALFSALLVSVIPVLPTNQVLCVGANGHVEVERAGDDCCAAADAASTRLREGAPAPRPAGAGKGECGSCFDFALIDAADEALGARAAVPVACADLVAAAIPSALAALPPAIAFAPLEERWADHPPLALERLASVVLRL